jgi:FAD/FMN-containing dehydrogenase
MSKSTVDFEELRRAIDGVVLVADSDDRRADALPKLFNARYDDSRPQAVVRCASAGDVVETVSFLRRHDLAAAIRGGGHCFAGRSTTPGVLIDVSPMRSISITDGVVRVGAGARLGEVYLGTIPSGITVPGGTCPSVGIAGLTLGGGLGILGRTHGLTSDRLVAATIVLADGRTIECDEHHHEDLFWALRGGGAGHFGVVTQLAFRPVRVPAKATSFHLTWPFSSAASVVAAWMRWSPVAPDELAASLVVAASGDPDEEPAVQVFGTMLGNAPDAQELLDGLTVRVGDDPDSDALEEMTYLDALRLSGARAGQRLEEPRTEQAGRGAHFVKSEFFARPLAAETLAALLGHLSKGRVAGQSRELDFSPWGGAYNRVPAGATAFVHRNVRFCLKHTAMVAAEAPAAERAGAHAWATRSWETVHPFGTGGVFPNFPDRELADWGRAYYGTNYERLLETKAQYDPGNIFRSPQSLAVR